MEILSSKLETSHLEIQYWILIGIGLARTFFVNIIGSNNEFINKIIMIKDGL